MNTPMMTKPSSLKLSLSAPTPSQKPPASAKLVAEQAQHLDAADETATTTDTRVMVRL